GAVAVAIGKSGVADALANKVLALIGQRDPRHAKGVKALLITLLLCAAIASQNLLPIHIAFIPLLVPPLLYVMDKLALDRRLVACVLTFGLITPYMFLPVGFGGIRSEEHTSELQSRFDLVCRLLLEKKKSGSARVYVAQ